MNGFFGNGKTLTLLTVVSAGLLTACSSVPFSVDTPAVGIRSLSLLESTDESQRFLVELALANPNDFPISIQGIRFNLRVAGEGFIDGRTSNLVSIPANGELTVRVDVRSEFVSSVSRLMAYLRGPESTLPYEIEGELELDTRPPRYLRFDAEGSTPLLIVAGGEAVKSP